MLAEVCQTRRRLLSSKNAKVFACEKQRLSSLKLTSSEMLISSKSEMSIDHKPAAHQLAPNLASLRTRQKRAASKRRQMRSRRRRRREKSRCRRDTRGSSSRLPPPPLPSPSPPPPPPPPFSDGGDHQSHNRSAAIIRLDGDGASRVVLETRGRARSSDDGEGGDSRSDDVGERPPCARERHTAAARAERQG